MRTGRMILFLLTIAAMTAGGSGPADGSPVLVKLRLTGEADYQKADQLNLVVYHKFPEGLPGGNLVIAEFERSNLSALGSAGLTFEIIDEEPWTESYYLISEDEGTEGVGLSEYGQVLASAERFHFMKIADEKARALAEKGYLIVKVFRHPLPLKYPPPRVRLPKYYARDSGIDSLLSLISQDSLYAWDLRLQNFQTRYSYSDSIIRARDWLYNEFVSFGIDSVWLHHYYHDSHQWNVVATVIGTVQPDQVIVVGGHYDSVVYGSGSPLIWAPGADDNGSGTVATLEMARIVAQHPLPVTVMFVPFAQEEQGLVGSSYFAQYLHALRTDLPLMINSDMIGHSVDADPDVAIYADAGAMDYVDLMIDMANTYTSLHPYYSGQTSGSDHYSFYQQGYQALCAEEGDFFYGGWHKNYDVVDSLNFPYMTEVTKMCLATLITVARSVGYRTGDANRDGVIDASDVIFVVNYLFRGDVSPNPLGAGDVTCDGTITAEDLVFLINYLYKEGPAPPASC
ncbi:MAG: M20/M25/M40 family metallo-hydrolase [Candidatus Zixiibacteriota bacterium]